MSANPEEAGDHRYPGGHSFVGYFRDRPTDILVIWDDNIGIGSISAYNMGMMGYQTHNIDRIANEGAPFTDAFGEQSCTAGRSAFIPGQHPFRTKLLTIGVGLEAAIRCVATRNRTMVDRLGLEAAFRCKVAQ